MINSEAESINLLATNLKKSHPLINRTTSVKPHSYKISGESYYISQSNNSANIRYAEYSEIETKNPNSTNLVLIIIITFLITLCILQILFSSLTVYVFCKSRFKTHVESSKLAKKEDFITTEPGQCLNTTRSLQEEYLPKGNNLCAQVKDSRFLLPPKLAFSPNTQNTPTISNFIASENV